MRAISRGSYRSSMPVMSAEMRIAVPLADSQLTLSTAASVVAESTTGGTRCTSLSRPGMANFGDERALSSALTLGRPHSPTTTVSTSHGTTGLIEGIVV